MVCVFSQYLFDYWKTVVKKFIVLACLALVVFSVKMFGACPSADLSNDCKVNLDDLAILASEWLITYSEPNLSNMSSEWLTEGVPENPATMNWVFINDPGVDENGDGIPEGTPFIGYISKYETTNAQFCKYLNDALVSGDVRVQSNQVYKNSGIYNNLLCFKTSAFASTSQIDYSGGTFTVRSRDGCSMANHPVVEVTWYGAMAFCDYYGYRLPDELEWQAVADYDGTYTYGCGRTLNQSIANYHDGAFANPLKLTSFPYSNPVDYYPDFGYGLNDMAGNAWEWTSTFYSVSDGSMVIRGGSWGGVGAECAVWYGTDTEAL